jgi:predicted phosphodiesterase
VYATNDYVLSGHTHVPHLIEAFFPVDRPEMRNQKKVIFLNPGSVGQPRNHNPRSHYAVLDPLTGEIHMNRVPYDIEAEIAAYPDGFDEFYRIRLRVGV